MCLISLEYHFCYVMIRQQLTEFLLCPILPAFPIFLMQSAPLTEQQQAAIITLSHAVAERPFPANLVGFMMFH